MPEKPTPNWHPISALPLIASLLDGQLKDIEKQYQSLVKAREQPYLLDDDTVDRIRKVYSENLDQQWVFEEQLARWKRGNLSSSQSQEVDRLVEVVARLRKIDTDILDLAAELRQGTIDRIMEKSDTEVAMEVLSGKLKPLR